MFVQGRNNGQWRRGLAYKSGGLGVAGSNPVCPKQNGQLNGWPFLFLGSQSGFETERKARAELAQGLAAEAA